MSLLLIVGFVITLILSAFFSAAETSFIASSKEKIQIKGMAGHKNVKLLLSLLDNKKQLIAAALLFNTVVNVMLSSISTVITTSLCFAFFQSQIVIVLLSTVITTFIVLIFGELTPKTMALMKPEKTALIAAPIFSLLVKLNAPFSLLTHMIVQFLCKSFGFESTDHVSRIDALRMAIMQHKDDPSAKNERNMLGGILDLPETEVKDIMCHRSDIMAINIEKIDEIFGKIEKTQYTRLPVYRDNTDNIIGVLHVKDFLIALHKNKNSNDPIDINKILRKPLFVPYSTTLEQQLNIFKKKRSHMALIIDEYGSVMGLVTLEDVIEEITGDIEDEHDIKENDITLCSDGTIIVAGDLSVRDFNKEFEDAKLEEGESTTIAGLVIDAMHRMPKSGEFVEISGYKIIIKDASHNKISSLMMKKIY